MALERAQTVCRQHDGCHAVSSILRDGDVIKSAKRGRHLILHADTLSKHALLDMNRLVREGLLRDMAAVESMDGIDEPDGKCRARSEARPGRQVAVMVNFEPFADLEPLEHTTDRGMLNLVNLLDVLDDGVDDAEAMVEEWRQFPDADVAVLVDGGRQYGTTVLA